MTTAEEFYRLRDQRTVQLGGEPAALAAPVCFRASPRTASSAAGQVLLLALVNMAARVHRRLVVDVPERELVAPTLLPSGTLLEGITTTVTAIDPFCHFQIGPPNGNEQVVIGIGDDIDACNWYVGATRYRATLTDHPVPVTDDPSTVWGAGLAACMGAAATYYAVHGHSPRPAQLSLWDLTYGTDAPIGISTVLPIDVGSVAAIGAGAVGSALCYWGANVGVIGDWEIVDHDVVELHNTNRSMAFLAMHAGWSDGVAVPKAPIAAALIGATPRRMTYAEWTAMNRTPDLVLALANDYGVRHDIGQRGEPIVLHATTSRSVTAELHRHIPDIDQCIGCRFPDDRPPDLSCSTVPALDPDRGSDDAALPFLSAAAGLLLARALEQLPDGPQLTAPANHWRIHFLPGAKIVQAARWACAASCATTVPSYARRAGQRGRRWSGVDVQSGR
jgi:hypothetical protein